MQTRSSNVSGLQNTIPPAFILTGKLDPPSSPPRTSIFNEHTILTELSLLSIQNINSITPNPIKPPGIRNPIKDPNEHKRSEIENPLEGILNEISTPIEIVQQNFDLPSTEQTDQPKLTKKYESNMLIVRRKKMKKHKLKKLRKKMKFVYAKRNQRREWKKEKRFQDGLLSQIKEAEKFSAEDYVTEKLAKLKGGQTSRHFGI